MIELAKNAKDLTGQRFGMLVALQPVGRKNGLIWECRCDCGNVKNVKSRDLLCGDSKSCGCNQHPKGMIRNYRHGLGRTRLYGIYTKMVSHCYRESAGAKNYKNRGISICDEWLGENGVVNFCNWAIDNGYSDKLSIDRIDVNGNYCPENCRWATTKQQANNKTTSHYIVFKGEKRTLSEWAERLGIKRETINSRLHRGWSEHDALSVPVGMVRK